MASMTTKLAWLAAVSLIACAAFQNYPEEDSAIRTPDDLEGKWCDARPGHLLCFEAHGSSYSWLASDCSETGKLLPGGVMQPRGYNSDGEPLCYASSESGDGPAPYAADFSWTKVGIHVSFWSGLAPIDLAYVPELQP